MPRTRTLLLGLLAVIAFAWIVFLLVGRLLPAEYRVQRSAVIHAPPERIFPLINSPRRWPHWAGWSGDDYPEVSYRYEGPAEGVGAIQMWRDPAGGDGRLEIIGSEPNVAVAYRMHIEGFAEPMHGSITLEPDAGATRVTWTAGGQLGPGITMRWTGLTLDSLIGADFEAALAQLKALAESDRTDGAAPE